MVDIVERLRAREHLDTWNGEFVSKDAADEIEKLREERNRLREALTAILCDCDCETDVGCNNDFAEGSDGLLYCDNWVGKCALKGLDYKTTRKIEASKEK